jgi:hypothetical protein
MGLHYETGYSSGLAVWALIPLDARHNSESGGLGGLWG